MIVRAYDDLWKVEKRLYRVEDIEVPGAPLYSQIAFFFVGIGIMFGILSIFGMNDYEGMLVKYIVLPAVFSAFMTKKKFDGKRPDRFMLSLIRFYFMPHLICRYRPVRKEQTYQYDGQIRHESKNHLAIEKIEKGD